MLLFIKITSQLKLNFFTFFDMLFYLYKMKSRLFIVFGLLMLLFACKKEDPLPTNTNTNTTTQQDYRTVNVTVKHIYEFNPNKDSTVRDVRVRLYKSAEDRNNNTGLDADRSTDSNGVALITHRKENYYYIRTDHPVLGKKLAEVSTPAGTTSFVEVLYY